MVRSCEEVRIFHRKTIISSDFDLRVISFVNEFCIDLSNVSGEFGWIRSVIFRKELLSNLSNGYDLKDEGNRSIELFITGINYILPLEMCTEKKNLRRKFEEKFYETKLTLLNKKCGFFCIFGSVPKYLLIHFYLLFSIHEIFKIYYFLP